MTPRQISGAVLTLAATLVFAPTAHANLILNPSFEAPDVGTGSFSVFSAIPGWTTTAGPGIEIQDHVAGSPFDGAQFVELDSFGNSAMAQTVATAAGQTYAFSFAYSPRRGVAPAESNGIDVLFNGTLLTSLAVSGAGLSDSVWTVHDFVVTATGSSSTIEFRATGTSNSVGGYVDAVSLDPTSVPEPAALLLMSTALGAAGVYRRRRTR